MQCRNETLRWSNVHGPVIPYVQSQGVSTFLAQNKEKTEVQAEFVNVANQIYKTVPLANQWGVTRGIYTQEYRKLGMVSNSFYHKKCILKATNVRFKK